MIVTKIHNLAKQLWPINRSITGKGVRETLALLKDIIPSLTIRSVPSDTAVFDWTVPNERRTGNTFVTI